jgi:hypothetical protein
MIGIQVGAWVPTVQEAEFPDQGRKTEISHPGEYLATSVGYVGGCSQLPGELFP